MLAQFGANFAAVHSAVGQFNRFRFGILLAGMAVTVLTLGGCMPLAGADPAQSGAKVAGVGYRSTIAPCTSLRATAPSPWREQNDRVAPAPKSGR